MGTRDIFIDLAHVKKDHPHACGDKVHRGYKCSRVCESSPRVWGQGFICYRKSTTFGIIPTRVGTSKYFVTFTFRDEDHPHACGDKSAYPSIMLQYKGSSPRVWGQDYTSQNN